MVSGCSLNNLRKVTVVLVLLALLSGVTDGADGEANDQFEPDVERFRKMVIMTYRLAVRELDKLPSEERVGYSLILADVQLSEFNDIKVARKFNDYALGVAAKENLPQGRVYLSRGMIAEAANKNKIESINAFEKAAKCFRKDKDVDSLKACLSMLGTKLYNYGYFTRSEKCFIELLKLLVTKNDVLMKARTLFNVGEVYSRMGKTSSAITAAKRARDIYKKADNAMGIADCNKLLGNTYMNRNNNHKAKQCYLEALVAYKKIKDSHGQGNCYFNLGLVCIELEQYGDAVKHLVNSSFRFSEAGSITGVGIAQMELGRAYYLQGSFGRAEASLKQAEYFLTGKSQYRLGQTKEYLGDLANAQKQKEQSLAYYKDSVKLFKEVKLTSSELRVQKKIQNLLAQQDL